MAVPFLWRTEAGANAVHTYWQANGQQMCKVAQVKDDSVILFNVAHGFGLSLLARLAMEPVPEGVVLRHLPEALEQRLARVEWHCIDSGIQSVCHQQESPRTLRCGQTLHAASPVMVRNRERNPHGKF
jgi:hypothetical protein